MTRIFNLTSADRPRTASDEEMTVARGALRLGPGEVAALVERARQHDAPAIEALFRAHMEGVHRVIYRLTGPVADLEDLMQTVFVEAFRSLSGFRGDALFSTWLARIAVRVTMHAIKRRPPRSLPIEEQLHLSAHDAGPERRAVARQGLMLLDRLLAELRPKRRAAFVLHVLEGYPMDEVAAILGASTAAVKVRVHDARRFIEKRVAREPAFAELLQVRTANSSRGTPP